MRAALRSGALPAAAGMVLIVLGLLVLLVETAAFDPGYYESEYTKNDTASYVGVSEETLDEATGVLLDYLQDRRDDLSLQVETSAGQREYYNEREKLHMVDVKSLNLGAVTFMWIALAAGGTLLGASFAAAHEKWRVCRACFFAVLGVLAAFFLIGAAAAADFTSFWITFHKVFFTNDLWTFDPRSSLLIRMFEEQFFFDLVARILLWFLAACFVMLAAAFWGWRRGRRKEPADAHTRH
ncbi:MAG: TIGR01906 family membrane protein [Clostridia bacterium]|nr:TIGR01906 family membrane protein [Clostridia bacterium]